MPASAQPRAESYTFPADYYSHASAKSELWSLWLLLATKEGKQLALQVRLGRVAIDNQRRSDYSNTSKWSFDRVFVLATAVTDATSGEFYPQQSQARSALDLAGTNNNQGQLWVNQHRLSVQASDRCSVRLALDLQTSERPLSLNLKSTGCPLIQSENSSALASGFAQQFQLLDGDWAGVSLVSGYGWLERAWGDTAPGFGDADAASLVGASTYDQRAPVVVDQFRVFLPEREFLVLTRTRRRDGTGTPVLSANLLSTSSDSRLDSSNTEIDYRKLQLIDQSSWQSVTSAEHYSSGWKLTWDTQPVFLTPVVKAQELSIGGIYRWSGFATVQSGSDAKSGALSAFVDLAPSQAGGRQ